MAFIARFQTTCRKRSGTQRMVLPSASVTVISATPLGSGADSGGDATYAP